MCASRKAGRFGKSLLVLVAAGILGGLGAPQRPIVSAVTQQAVYHPNTQIQTAAASEEDGYVFLPQTAAPVPDGPSAMPYWRSTGAPQQNDLSA
ncbi:MULTISPECIES: hypothetical protein [Caproicibacterium]|uniref:Uncharacterized protein n=1 Tax=Caproicibacterium argilliputei TaxID=3030016 RepID=A0AA97D9E6_9FIRM|nr:hypothetical protein [Caproicibacterium argilliputei]WOC32674.1 hypothetical protein PXC00_02030 [Caproicibacterium argilliputei]